MPRYTEGTDTGQQGTSDSSSQMIEGMGLTDTSGGTGGIGTEITSRAKQTVLTGTNQMPSTVFTPTQEDFQKIKLDYEIDPTMAGKMTIRRSSGNPRVPTFVYSGPQLFDENGRLSGKTYAADGSDIDAEFFGVKNAAERATMISTAEKLGFFFGSKPSAAMIAGTGADTSDRRAIQMLLDYGVRNQMTWQAVANGLASGKINPGVISGGGASYSVVSTEDAMSAVGEEFFRILKRPPTPAEARQAALNIQNTERARATGRSMDPTSLNVAAREQAKSAAPTEYAANAAGDALTRIFSLLGGR